MGGQGGFMRVALLHNLALNAPEPPRSAPSDYLYELDHRDNVQAYQTAMQSRGHTVLPMEGDVDLPARLKSNPVDICFNTCEGFRGDAREAQVPALLEMLGVPYSGSQVLTLALTLDKAMTNRVLAFHGLPTPAFQEINTPDAVIDPRLHFPLFVKPLREGTGMGINGDSIVNTAAELHDQAAYVIEAYRQPALVEEYIDGRDVTVGIVGNGFDAHIFPLSMIDYSGYGEGAAQVYGAKYKIDRADEYRYQCPADLPDALADEIRRLAAETMRVTNTVDMARIDFRLNRHEGDKPYILEINSLPGITPISDMTLMAEAEGWAYADLINSVLDAALKRNGLTEQSIQNGRVAQWVGA